MTKKRPNRRQAAVSQKHPKRPNWLVPGAVAALVIVAVIAVRWRLPADPRQQFAQASAAYPTDLARTEMLLRKAIQASDEPPADAAVLLGCALARRGAWQQVSRQLATADLNRARPELLAELGDLAMSAGQPDLAIQVFTASAGQSGIQQAQSLFMLVLLHRSAGHLPDALRCAEQLTQVEPEDVRWWRLLAQLYSQQDDEAQEVATFQRALQQPLPARDARAIRHKLLELLIHLGDAPAARLVLDQLEATAADVTTDGQRSDRVRLDANRARLLRLEGRPREALTSLDRAMPALGDVPLALGLRGMLLMDLAEFPAAITDLSRAVAALPYDETLHYKLAEAYRRTGQPQKSQQHLGQYQSIHAARLEIGELEAEAAERPLTTAEQVRLAQLRGQVGHVGQVGGELGSP